MTQALSDLAIPTLSQLQERILRDPALFARMFQYFTVQVSEMFRDPHYFRAIRDQVVPILQTYPSIKVWVAGCSSGEELWSLAVLFAEEKIADRTVLYATDINADALRQAENGIYSLRTHGKLQPELSGGGRQALAIGLLSRGVRRRQVLETLKSRVVFADHSLATDSVFLEAHLVSCRNVLIYFDRALQDRALGLFSDSLVRRGFLGLGSKESLSFSKHAGSFAEFNARERLYQKV